MDPAALPTNSLNFNVGVLGHIDSGKTSLCKAISTTASTASFDKNPQSQERGITLDLGFSSFCVPLPSHLVAPNDQIRYIQYTLVDCPGHASLIRTIISGAQIMDLMLLIVDVTKGIQTQTAECLVIGEITCQHMIVVLNKIDLLPESKREASISKMKSRLEKVLLTTKFTGCPIVAVAAHSGSSEGEAIGLQDLVNVLAEKTFFPKRNAKGSLLFSVDHCFSIRGQGTVMTGTMLSGSVRINDNIEIVTLKETRKVKSMQMFRQPVQQAIQGDRVGICVANFDAKLLERGFAAAPGTLTTLYGFIIQLHKIQHFKPSIKSRSKFHVTIGHDTVMGKIQLFSGVPDSGENFDANPEYAFVEEVVDATVHQENVVIFALIELESPVIGQRGQLIVASRLDADIHQNACRLAFYGKILEPFSDKDYASAFLPKLRIFKEKFRSGQVERMQDPHSVIVKNLVKKETDTTKFEGLKVQLSTGEAGIIDGSFGKSGKIKIRIPDGLKQTTIDLLSRMNKKRTDEDTGDNTKALKTEDNIEVKMIFKRYVYDSKKRMIQS